jgi:hypothetical protein
VTFDSEVRVVEQVKSLQQTVLDMRGSTPLSRSMSKEQKTITKQLQNLYSWTQFYQERGNKEQIRKCQTEIAQLKQAYNNSKLRKNVK